MMGEILRFLLEQKGMNQKDLAEKAHITEAAVSHYLSNNRTPRGTILKNIADALGTTPDFLLQDSAKAPERKSSIQKKRNEMKDMENGFRAAHRTARSRLRRVRPILRNRVPVERPEQEWYRRGYFVPLSLIIGTKARFIL